MYKLAAIIGGVLLMAGVALAGAVTSLGSTNSPTIGISQAAGPNVRQEDRGREVEQRGRANEPGEDVRRDGVAAAPRLTTTAPRFAVRDDHGDRDHGDRSGRGHGSDDGGHSGHGGHGGDD